MSMMSPQSVGAGLEEIELIYRRDLGKLQRLATAIVGNREAGCDVVQDAFARAVHRRGQFRREGSLEGWLWRIVVTTARDVGARLPSTPLSVEPGRGIDSHPVAEDDERATLSNMILRLPERQRHVLFLRYYGDLDYTTIANTLEISVGTVAATLSQARGNLRRLLMEVPR